MKRKNLVKILVLFILAGSIVNAEYLKENGEIYYQMPYYEIKSKVKDVDIESFETLREDRGLIGDYYAKDNKNVYLYGKKLKDVLPEGFETVKENYVKDSKNVYKIEAEITDSIPISSDNKINTKKISLDGLDVKTFRALENGKDVTSIDYFVDKNNIYYAYENLEKIQGADKNSFEVLGNYIAKDKNNVYYNGKKMENVDSKSFKNFGNFIGKDKNRVFYITGNEDIKDADAESFEIMGDTYYFRDKNNIFVIKYSNDFPDGEGFVKLPNIDRNSFITLSEEIGKDKNGVYYIDEKINGINPNKVKVIEKIGQDNYILQSENNYYLTFNSNSDLYDRKNDKIEAKKINNLNIDFSTFKYFGIFNYYKDKNSFYYHSDNDFKKIKSGIDVGSADKMLELNDFVKDKNNLYYFSNGKIEKINLNIDVKSLEFFDDIDSSYSNYIKDRNNVYFVDNKNGKVKIVKNADKNTFQIVNRNYGVDRKNVYYNGEKLDSVGIEGLKIFDDNYLKDNKNVYEIYTTDDEKIKIRAIKNLNIDVASFEDIFKEVFYKDKNSVYYVDMTEDKQELKKLEGADADTFEPGIFSKDKNSVYVDKQRLEGVSPKGFEILDNDLDFIKDYKNVFYLDRADDGITFIPRVQNIEGVDIATLEFAGGHYSKYYKDKNNVYFMDNRDGKIKFKKLSYVNPKTFEMVDNTFARDDKNLYLFEYKLYGIDAKTFEKISSNIVKDKNGLYFLEDIEKENENIEIKTRKINIKGLDLKTFERIDDYYYKDKNNVYYDLDNNLYTIKNADLATFEVLNSPYSSSIYFAKDKNNVYYQNKKINGIVADGFEQIQSNFIKDKNRLYKIDEDEEKNEIKLIPINEKVNLENFEEIGGNYYKDDKNLYYFGENEFKKIEGADPNSFKYDNENYTFIAKDKNNVYFEGEKVKGIDVNSAEGINGLWIKDKNNVFYEGKKLKGISSFNFSYFDGGLSYDKILVDKNGIYKFIETEDNKKTMEVTRLDSKGIDLETLERITSPMDSSNYFKDKNGVYFMDGNKFVKVNGADKDSFRVTMSGKYGKDKNNVYFDGKKMEGKNPVDFEEEMEIKQ
ncbi:cell wall-binding repeat protein [Leptotrichia wadei]|uniref:Cell wall-binding repeat protein n=2 Tax=Leptotrichia TaxID=32067 RepID=A0A133ZXQ2_9FUSO|nr:DKNYY domain-containing protein [Leptotrichia wadei]KXB60200.1 cell wall-binding repeat protein [Leptotrichia wadei]